MYTNETLGKALEDLTTAYNNFIKNAKDAAMEAMGDTVIAQIKQDAKDHISAELAAQKAALEQAIENAKAAINNSSSQAHTALQQAAATASGELTSSAEAKKLELAALIQTAEQAVQGKVDEAKTYIDRQLSAASQGLQEDINTKVSAAVATAEATLLAKINTKFIEYYKNGYIQMPGMPSPLEDASLHFEGYSWHEVNYDGNFFRAKGRNAKAFSSVKLTADQIKNGTYAFQDDEQGDSIRNISGSFGYKIDIESSSGCFKDTELVKYFVSDGGYARWRKCLFDLRDVEDINISEENRSRNLTFTFWVLVKNAE